MMSLIRALYGPLVVVLLSTHTAHSFLFYKNNNDNNAVADNNPLYNSQVESESLPEISEEEYQSYIFKQQEHEQPEKQRGEQGVLLDLGVGAQNESEKPGAEESEDGLDPPEANWDEALEEEAKLTPDAEETFIMGKPNASETAAMVNDRSFRAGESTQENNSHSYDSEELVYRAGDEKGEYVEEEEDGEEVDITPLEEFRSWLGNVKERAFFRSGDSGDQVGGEQMARAFPEEVKVDSDTVSLLQRRQAVMAQLIQKHPASALKNALRPYEKELLPKEADVFVEKVVTGRARVLVSCATLSDNGTMPEEHLTTEIEIEGERYDAFFDRQSYKTSGEILVHGVAMISPETGRSIAAVHRDTVIPLSKEERRVRRNAIPDSWVGVASMATENGERLVEYDPEKGIAELAKDAKRTVRSATTGSDVPTVGTLTVLFIPIDFGDMPGYPRKAWGKQPYTDAEVRDVMDRQLPNFYRQNSFGRLNIRVIYAPGVVRMPSPASFYKSNDQNYRKLYADFKKVWPNHPAHDSSVVLHGHFGDNFNERGSIAAGLGYVGAAGVIVNGQLDLRVVAHELGHNLGSFHANGWVVTDGTGKGYMLSYADQYDNMGYSASDGTRHYAANTKNHFGWIQDSQVLRVDRSGVFRLYPHDLPSSGQFPTLMLSIPINGNIARQKYRGLVYTIEYRALPVQPGSQNGVLLRFVQPKPYELNMDVCRTSENNPGYISSDCNSKDRTSGLLIDLKPQTGGIQGTADAYLSPTMAFFDTDAQVHIRTTLAPDRSHQIVSVIVGTNNCWGRGRMVYGRCVCMSAFVGVDCSVALRSMQRARAQEV